MSVKDIHVETRAPVRTRSDPTSVIVLPSGPVLFVTLVRFFL